MAGGHTHSPHFQRLSSTGQEEGLGLSTSAGSFGILYLISIISMFNFNNLRLWMDLSLESF